MDSLFTGNATRRPTVNLGGSRATNPHNDLVLQARQQRQQRETARRKDSAARTLQVRPRPPPPPPYPRLGGAHPRASLRVLAHSHPLVQAFYRGRKAAQLARDDFRSRFDALLPSSPSAPPPRPADALAASRLVAVSAVHANKGDIKRLATWCRAVLRPPQGATGASSSSPFRPRSLSPTSDALLHVLQTRSRSPSSSSAASTTQKRAGRPSCA